MDNVDKCIKTQENQCLDTVDNDKIKDEEEIVIIKINSNQTFNESNLMTIPFISLKNKKVSILERNWESKGVKRGITVKGSVEYGCPTICELDVLLALFRILIKNMDYKYEYNKNTKKVKLPQKINFTYKDLAEELGYSGYGGKTKTKLEKSIKILTETTIYTSFGIKDCSKKDYIDNFNGQESTRILKNYKSYSYEREKKAGTANPKTVREKQSVEIDDFFFDNMCNNFFKIFNYDKYMSFNLSLSKKMYLLLCQWSHGYEKFLHYETLYDYLSLEVKTPKDKYYYNRLIKDSLEELKKVEFINEFEITKNVGINLIFNMNKKIMSNNRYKYRTDEDVIKKLQEYGLSTDEWLQYYRLDNREYVKALLRYVDDRVEKKLVPNPKEYLLKGLITEKYNVSEYML